MDCFNLHPPQRVDEIPDEVGLGENRCWPVRGTQISRAFPHAIGALDTKLEKTNLCNYGLQCFVCTIVIWQNLFITYQNHVFEKINFLSSIIAQRKTSFSLVFDHITVRTLIIFRVS